MVVIYRRKNKNIDTFKFGPPYFFRCRERVISVTFGHDYSVLTYPFPVLLGQLENSQIRVIENP